MANESTSKMLAKMLKDTDSSVVKHAEEKAPEYVVPPQLKPGVDMEQALVNILGPSVKKEHIPS